MALSLLSLSLYEKLSTNFRFLYSGDFSIPEVEEAHEVEEVDVPCVPDAEEEQGESYTRNKMAEKVGHLPKQSQ